MRKLHLKYENGANCLLNLCDSEGNFKKEWIPHYCEDKDYPLFDPIFDSKGNPTGYYYFDDFEYKQTENYHKIFHNGNPISNDKFIGNIHYTEQYGGLFFVCKQGSGSDMCNFLKKDGTYLYDFDFTCIKENYDFINGLIYVYINYEMTFLDVNGNKYSLEYALKHDYPIEKIFGDNIKKENGGLRFLYTWDKKNYYDVKNKKMIFKDNECPNYAYSLKFGYSLLIYKGKSIKILDKNKKVYKFFDYVKEHPDLFYCYRTKDNFIIVKINKGTLEYNWIICDGNGNPLKYYLSNPEYWFYHTEHRLSYSDSLFDKNGFTLIYRITDKWESYNNRMYEYLILNKKGEIFNKEAINNDYERIFPLTEPKLFNDKEFNGKLLLAKASTGCGYVLFNKKGENLFEDLEKYKFSKVKDEPNKKRIYIERYVSGKTYSDTKFYNYMDYNGNLEFEKWQKIKD